jgi:serine phosphatase RsbU (regulator of sigma subunit)
MRFLLPSKSTKVYHDGALRQFWRGGWLAAARIAWVVFVLLTLTLVVASIPMRYGTLTSNVDERSLHNLGLSLRAYAGYVFVLNLGVVVAHIVIAGVIFWRRADEWMALLVAFALVANGTIPSLSLLYQSDIVHPGWLLLANLVVYLGLVSSVILLYVFPSGEFVPPWTRWMAISWAGLAALVALVPGVTVSLPAGPLLIQGMVFVVWSGIGVFAQIYRYWNVSSPVQRQQTKWAMIGLAAAAMGPLLLLANTGAGGDTSQTPIFLYQRVGASFFTFSLLVEIISTTALRLATILFPLSFAVAILRYRLWDIDVIIRHTLVYGTLTWALLLIYFASVLILEWLFRALVGQGDFAIVASTVAIALLFNPLRARIQAIIDQRFYRRKYDTAQTLAAFGTSLRSQVDLSELIRRLETVIGDTIQPAHVLTWLRTPVGFDLPLFHRDDLVMERTELKPADAAIPPDDPLVGFFRSASGAVELERVDLDSPALHRLQSARIEVVLPLISQGELIGWLSLGPRLSQQGYSADDLILLTNLAAQAAPAVRVAQLASEQQVQALERERLEQELRIARVVQQTLLPRELPSVPGWEMAVHWQPARAIGGDFYDFLPLEDGRLALVVGDVADKGVPAALIMATTRSILRGAGRRQLSPGQALERSNELLHPELPPGMFVTCLYAILDPASGRLQYANAGHNLPYRHCNGRVAELWATGMPLGLMPGMRYEEFETTVEPGECLLLYSDGLVEAHNPQQEMFGFPRLQALVAKLAWTGPALIEGLLSELAAFTGAGWEQEDDVTLLVIQRTDYTRTQT